jgi:ribosomal protein S18 acetylase RimI-like enzyme
MIEDITIRPARLADCPAIAELVGMATYGGAEVAWQHRDPAAPTLETGARVFAAGESNESYRNCLIVEHAGAVAGLLYSYPMAKEPPEVTGLPEAIAAFARFHLWGSFFIDCIALYPGCRGQGIGTRLLGIARGQARERGLDVLSLQVYARNPAVRLYERHGFVEAGRQPVVPHPLIRMDGDVLLMKAGI